MSSREITTKTGLKVTKKSDAATMGLRDFGTNSRTRTSARSSTPLPARGRAPPASRGIQNPTVKQAPAMPYRGAKNPTPRPMQRTSLAPRGQRRSVSGVTENSKTTSAGTQKPIAMRRSDALNVEMLFYNTTLKLIVPTMTSERDRALIQLWLTKLLSLEFQGDPQRDTRNRFLFALTVTALNDEAFGIFSTAPPQGALPTWSSIPPYLPPACRWQLDDTWQRVLNDLPSKYVQEGCTCQVKCTEIPEHIEKGLNEEFRFLLHLSRPYAALFNDPGEKQLLATWLQFLCAISPNSCSSMKGKRNDFMMALIGYADDLKLSGPFTEYPDFNTPIPSLMEAVENNHSGKHIPDFIDPIGKSANDFLLNQPIPEEGAFCYITLTGDIIKELSSPMYADDLKLSGPFTEYPNYDTPIPYLLKAVEANHFGKHIPEFMDPKGMSANDFLLNQPIPEEGAFCYITLTGDIINEENIVHDLQSPATALNHVTKGKIITNILEKLNKILLN